MPPGVHVHSWRRAVLDKHTNLDVSAVLVGLALSAYMNKTGVAYPSRALLAEGCRISMRTVTNAIRDLEAAGLLRVERGRGRGRSNIYHACLPGEKGVV